MYLRFITVTYFYIAHSDLFWIYLKFDFDLICFCLKFALQVTFEFVNNEITRNVLCGVKTACINESSKKVLMNSKTLTIFVKI